MVELIITEKPSQSEKIAQALATGKITKKIITKVPYYEIEHNNKKIIIGCAVGHLYNLTEKVKSFKYPIFDLIWKPSSEISKFSEFSKKYLNVLKKICKQANEFTVACDYDTEGSLIGYNIIRFVCNQKDANRMKFSTLTKKELVESYNKKSKHLDFPLIHSGETRHYLDYFYGINISRALMLAIKTTGAYKTLSSGRVQGPALKILAKRELEIKKFKPEKYWQIEAINSLTLLHEKDKIFDKKEADKIYTKIKSEKSAIIKSLTKKQFYQEPPNPFDLTSLQVEAYRLFGITPKNTLSLAQELYTHAYTSYPRTSSNQLPESINYKELLTNLSKQKKYETLAKELLKNKSLKPNNGNKKDPAHPCFTENTFIKFNPSNKTFKELSSTIKNWKYDSKKGSFYAHKKFYNLHSYNHEMNKLVKEESYKIWKTPIDSYLLKLFTKNNKIELTKNHEIYALTKKDIGYVFSGDLEGGDYIFYKPDEEKQKYKIRLTEKEFLKGFSKKHIKDIYHGKKRILKTKEKIKKFFNELTKENAKTLARIIGFCMGDGHISFTKPSINREKFPTFSFVGDNEGMEDLKRDIKSLGFNSYLIKKTRDYSYLNGKGIFARILIVLNCPYGDKVSSRYTIPKWILNSDNSIKSNFLKGILGAELTKIRIHSKSKRDIRSFTFTQNKIKELKNDFEIYLNQIRNMLKDLKVETSKLKIKDKIIRKKDKKQTIEGTFDILNNRKNIIVFLSKIGYSYSNYKDRLGRKALAYLLYRELILDLRDNQRKIAIGLNKNLKTYKEISDSINISKHTVKGWIYYKKGNKEKHISVRDIPEFNEFSFSIPKGLLPEKIIKKKYKKYKGFVYDLEIKNTHNYFAGGFLVHNCIHPTGETSKKLSDYTQKIYDLIVKRTLASFAEKAKRETVNIRADIKKEIFVTKGTRTIEKGWHEFYQPYVKQEEVELPKLKEKDKIKIKKINKLEKQTEPPRRYSEASIIKELEKRNLGTKATRAAIVDALYQRDYVKEKSIEVTNLGLKNIEVLDKYVPEILDEKLTQHFEEELEKIIENKAKPKDILEESKEHLTKVLEKFRKHEKAIGKELLESLRETQEKESIVGKCPNCKTNNLRILYSKRFKSYFIACAGYPKCKTTFSLTKGLPKPTDKKCTECGSPLVKIIRKGVRPFDYCFNKMCPKRLKWIEENKKKVQEFKKQTQNQKENTK